MDTHDLIYNEQANRDQCFYGLGYAIGATFVPCKGKTVIVVHYQSHHE